ncbi:MAG: hypothetical protein AAGF12_31415 [Myxococcota bacterium]
MPASRFVCLFALVFTPTLVACQGPTEAEYDEVASGLGSLVANSSGGGDVGSMSDAVLVVRGEVPADLSAMGEGSYRGARAGLEYRYAVSCLDASGATSACGTQTDGGSLAVAWSGNLTLPNFRGEVDRAGQWTLTGVPSGTAEFNGHGTFDVAAEWRGFFGRMNSYELHYEANYDAIQIDTQTLEVLSGTARFDIDATRLREGTRRSVEREFAIEAILEFSPENAVLTLDGTRNYTVALSDGAVERF